MFKGLKKIVIALSVLAILAFLLFLINQISGIYLLVNSYSPFWANIVLGVMILGVAALLCWPVVLFFKLPGSLKLPKTVAEQPAYQQKLLKRLQKNATLRSKNIVPTAIDDLPVALDALRAESNQAIFSTANAVFLTTSVSQNGKLDALTILATQSRMVWKIAHIYYQRPSLRQLLYLYANVGAASFLAAELEEIDITQQLEPVLKSFFKNAAGKSIPVIGPTAHMVMDSLLQGATNAFLTLRVGNITCSYCASETYVTRKQIKRRAMRDAATQLRTVIARSSGQIISSIMTATKKAGVDTIKNTWEGVKNTGSRISDTLVETGKKVNPFKKDVSEKM